MANDSANKDNIKGIWFEKEYMRTYPYDSLAAAMIGYCSDGDVGALGIESEYNNVLNGTNGRKYGYYTDNNAIENTVTPPEDGRTVVSTIDVNVQSIVEQEILNWNEAHKSGTKDGSLNMACLIMNPNNGEVIAMASYPGCQVEGYNIGGKTGTAEKIPRDQGNYLVSFIGFAPYNNPDIVIYTIVDTPNVEDQAHSSYAQEITKNVLEQILPYMNIDRVDVDPVD